MLNITENNTSFESQEVHESIAKCDTREQVADNLREFFSFSRRFEVYVGGHHVAVLDTTKKDSRVLMVTGDGPDWI